MKPVIVPQPTTMPIDREAWRTRLDLSNFVNGYYQYRDLQSLPAVRTVLIIGPGQGLDTQVLRWRGYQVTTFDIDDAFKPDCVGSVHEMRVFAAGQFDAVIASHVLEHLAEPYLNASLSELARVGRYALVYLPVAGKHMHGRFIPGFKGIDCALTLDVLNYLQRPDGITPCYCQGQHFWEIGMHVFRDHDIVRRMSPLFEVGRVYRNRDWIPSLNFVLRSRISPGTELCP